MLFFKKVNDIAYDIIRLLVLTSQCQYCTAGKLTAGWRWACFEYYWLLCKDKTLFIPGRENSRGVMRWIWGVMRWLKGEENRKDYFSAPQVWLFSSIKAFIVNYWIVRLGPLFIWNRMNVLRRRVSLVKLTTHTHMKQDKDPQPDAASLSGVSS